MRIRGIFSLLTVSAVFVLTAGAFAPAAEAQSVTWKQLFPRRVPSARAFSAMAYDPVSKKMVLFGGWDGTAHLNDTWTFDGTTWTRRKTAASPSGRAGAAMAFDRKTRKLVLFGGFDGAKYLGDTWLWDGAASHWTKAHPKTSPPGLTGPMLFTDPKDGHVDEFGGYNGKFYQSATWRWAGTTWTQLNPASVPGARSIAVASLDGARKNVVLFGGLGDVRTDNTWTWDGANWTQMSPTVQPPTRYGAGSAFDPKLQMVVIFGGGTGGVDQNQTWAWTGADWTQLSPTKFPAARESMGMDYDAASGQLLVFGGLGGNTLLHDTWKLIRH